jgi:hypothetical protein
MSGNLVFQDTLSIAAAGSAKPLAGEPLERPPFDAFVHCAINGSAAGLRASVTIGGVNNFDDLAVNALNRFPIMPDDLIVTNGLCPAGALNRIVLRNPTAGALIHFTYASATLMQK